MTSLEPAASNLVRSIALLGLDASDQIAYTKALSVDVDELALTLDDYMPFLPALKESGALSDRDVELATLIHGLLTRITASQDPGLWTEAGLSSSAEWERIRAVARLFVMQA